MSKQNPKVCVDARTSLLQCGPVHGLAGGEPFSLGAVAPGEMALFDSFANEQMQISGTPIDYWFVNAAETVRDPLYGEPTEKRVFEGPYRITAWFSAPHSTPSAQEEGIVRFFDSSCWAARKNLEDSNLPRPREGDVLHVWDTPFMELYSTMDNSPPPGAGMYFNVIKVEPDGFVFDTANFVGYRFDLKRRTEFTPERRLNRP